MSRRALERIAALEELLPPVVNEEPGEACGGKTPEEVYREIMLTPHEGASEFDGQSPDEVFRAYKARLERPAAGRGRGRRS
jgi:hypothetical protein